MMLSGLLKELKIAAVPHGFRSSFRDWAAEETNHPREVIEAALAHVVRNPVEAGLCPARTCLSGDVSLWTTGRALPWPRDQCRMDRPLPPPGVKQMPPQG